MHMTIFINKYRRLTKEKEVSPQGYSATTAYLAACEEQKIAPTPIGLLKWDGEETEINVENYLMGKKYALALSSSMKYLKPEKLNLQSNNLGSNGSISILSNLSEQLTELDLSKNDMGDEAMPKLVSWLESVPNKCRLEFLNLSKNKLSDQSLFNLSEALIRASPPLRHLDLSHNKMDYNACISLGDYILGADYLKIMHLQWNKIHADGAVKLFEAISQNHSIRNIDLSWNMIGVKGKNNNETAEAAIANAINAGVIKHLDISYNSLNTES